MAAIAAVSGSALTLNIGSGRVLHVVRLTGADGDTYTAATVGTIESCTVSFADAGAAAADSVAVTYATNVVTLETAGTQRVYQLLIIGTQA